MNTAERNIILDLEKIVVIEDACPVSSLKKDSPCFAAYQLAIVTYLVGVASAGEIWIPCLKCTNCPSLIQIMNILSKNSL
jgi:hypothetical protein